MCVVGVVGGEIGGGDDILWPVHHPTTRREGVA